jgi:drug/metabolite transporter (DMT)-like permease
MFVPFFIYQLIRNYKNPEWFDLIAGLLDFLILALISASLSNLTVGEYISYGTSSTIFTAIILYCIDKKILPIIQYIGLLLILSACILLVVFSGMSNIISVIIILMVSLLYTLSNILVEKFVKTQEEKKFNYYWTKTVSGVINLSIGLTSEVQYKTLSTILLNTNHLYYVLVISFLISLTENVYYFLKVKIISYYETKNINGSIIITFLDIIRRFIMIIVSVFLFQESYDYIIYVAFSLMILGVLCSIIDVVYIKEKVKQCFYRELVDEQTLPV